MVKQELVSNISVSTKDNLRKYLNGENTLEESIEEIQKNSRHYAKRQYTWFNNKMNIKWFTTDFNNFNNTYNEIIDYLEKNK